MLTIITPPNAITATATESGDYLTLSLNGATLMLSTLPRPDNRQDVIYRGDSGALQYLPGTVPTIVAVLACSQPSMSLTPFPLPDPSAPAGNTMHPI